MQIYLDTGRLRAYHGRNLKIGKEIVSRAFRERLAARVFILNWKSNYFYQKLNLTMLFTEVLKDYRAIY